jgi:hypothetical protein
MSDKVLYVAGPMSYRPQFNFPLFDWVTAVLREQGHTVISPAELDSAEVRGHAMASLDGAPGAYEAANDKTWGDFLSRDVKIIADEITGVVLLPEWFSSRGAKLEAFVALLCEREFYQYRPEVEGYLKPVSQAYVRMNVTHE